MSKFRTDASSQAELLKAQGNQLFSKEKLGAAIDAYTEAITLCPKIPVYWTNRALCYRKRNEWSKVEADCKKALELDKESLKAHYMLGLAYIHNQHFAEAIREFEKALQLARGGGGGSNMVEEIWQELAKAKFNQWQVDSAFRREKQEKLRVYLTSLIQADYERQKGALSTSQELHESKQSDSLQSLQEEHQERVNTLENVFDKAGAPDRPEEIPDHLCCKITMDIFRDPVVTPSGITYERSVLLSHLNRGKKFDPVSRAPLQMDQVYPNLALRDSVQSYLDEHGWAYNTGN